ncbi:MAG: hypothetical protein ACRDTB_28055, partial [Actinophytocola sp.]
MWTRTFPGLGFDPTPGSAADAEAVLTRLADASSVVDGSARGLRRAGRPGAWRGPAAAAFRSGASGLAGGLDEAVAALRAASRAVSVWRSRLMANQREADELEAVARRLVPDAVEELDRVRERARRLRARHVRQAAHAAAAVRSAAGRGPGSGPGSLPAWASGSPPGSASGSAWGWVTGSAESAARLSGRVTGWTGSVALGLASPE